MVALVRGTGAASIAPFTLLELPKLITSLHRRALPTLLSVSLFATICLSHSDAQAGKHPSRRSTVKESYAGSAETTKERERRLTRECRGRPNAGACLGYGL